MEITPARKLAVILHADIVGSTALVKLDEELAHKRMRHAFDNFSEHIKKYGGLPHEIRGDALVAEFAMVSDAISAALAFQNDNASQNEELQDKVKPVLRIGIAMGEVVVADKTVTGEGVILAQRLEQLAKDGGICLQGAAYDTVPKRLPFNFVNLGEKKVKGFDEPVRTYSVNLVEGADIPVAEKASTPGMPAPADRPSIAVLPFTNLSGDPDQEYFADGIVEDIITDLSRFKELLVIARNSSFSYKRRKIGVHEIAHELGVRYIVEGSVRKSGKHLRVTAQLIDSSNQSHLWGERYDRELEDVFAVQDEIVETIVGTLVARVERHGLEGLMRKHPSDLRAYDFMLKARAVLCDSAETNSQCRELYLAALRADPQSADACCGISMTHGLDYSSGWGESSELSQEQALKYAIKAVSLDDDNSEAHTRLGNRRIYSREYDLAIYHLDKALSLNPNNCAAWAYKGMYYIWTGKPEKSLFALNEATRRNPFNVTWYLWFQGLAYYCLMRYQEAIVPLAQSISHSPNFIAPRRHLAACYAQLGEIEKAAEQCSAIMDLDPNFSIAELAKTLMYRDSSDLEHYLDGLRKAGLPE